MAYCDAVRRGALIGVAAAVAVVAICIGAFVGLAYRPGYWPVTSAALARSVSHEVGATTALKGYGCHRRATSRERVCSVYSTQHSNFVSYVVKLHGRRCWSAYTDSRVPGLRRSASGCVGLLDRIGLLDQRPGRGPAGARRGEELRHASGGHAFAWPREHGSAAQTAPVTAA
jgi:hypothetical protein